MNRREAKIDLSAAELSAAFTNGIWADSFPPVLTVGQAAQLAGVPASTIYSWSSQGLLSSCAVRKGKRLRIWRDRFINFLFEKEEE